jgi:hypothetical protein
MILPVSQDLSPPCGPRLEQLKGAVFSIQDRLGLRSQAELGAVGFFFVFEVIAKVWTVFSYRFNSDEPQHLHVIWAWTHGMVQYRDVFDNHMPLFQIMCAPILGMLG